MEETTTKKIRKNLDLDVSTVKILKDHAVTNHDSSFKAFAEKVLEEKAIEIQNDKIQTQNDFQTH